MLDKLTQQSQALWYTAADRVELRDVDMPPPKSGEVIVKAHFSGISRGTERLVFRGASQVRNTAACAVRTRTENFHFRLSTAMP